MTADELPFPYSELPAYDAWEPLRRLLQAEANRRRRLLDHEVNVLLARPTVQRPDGRE